MNITIKNNETVSKISIQVTRPTSVKGVSILISRDGPTEFLLKESNIGLMIDSGVIYAENGRRRNDLSRARKLDRKHTCGSEYIWILNGSDVVRVDRNGKTTKVRDSEKRRDFISACKVLKESQSILKILKDKDAIVRVMTGEYGRNNTYLFFDNKLFQLGCEEGFKVLLGEKVINKNGKIIGKTIPNSIINQYFYTVQRISDALAEVKI